MPRTVLQFPQVHRSLRPRVALALAAAVIACSGGDGPTTVKRDALTAVQATPTTLSLIVPQTAPLQADLVGLGASTGQGTVTFSSSANAIASVNASGVVTAVSAGTATITVTGSHPSTAALNASTVTTTVAVTVSLPPNALTNVTIAPSAPTVIVGQTVALVPTITTANASVTASCGYASSTPAMATVTGGGVVSGVAPGSPIITVTCNGNGGGTTANSIVRTVTVNVIPPPVASVELTVPFAYLQPGPGTGRVSTTAVAVLRDVSNAVLTGRAITWTSTVPAVATVNSAGVVSALSTGNTQIRATSEGVSSTVNISVVRAFGAVFADQPSVANYLSGINSAGQGNPITRTAVGRYTVTFPDLGPAAIGRHFSFHVNSMSVSPNATISAPTAMCHLVSVSNATPVSMSVRCEDPITGAAKDAVFRGMVIGEWALDATHAFTMHTAVPAGVYAPDVAYSFNTANAAMSINPNSAPGEWNDALVRHNQGVVVTSQLSFTQVISAVAGRACYVRNNIGSSAAIENLCFDRATGIVNVAHQTLRLTSGRQGQIWGTAMIDAATGTSTGQGTTSSGGIATARTGAGKYTVTFSGLNATTGTLGIVANGWGGNDFVYCSHFVRLANPLTVDIACFDKFGAFSSDQLSGVQLLVLR